MSEPADEAAPEGSGKRRFSAAGVLKTAGVIIPLLAGALGLLFTLQPDLKPCLGENKAEFTGVPVFPRSSSHEILRRVGESEERISEEGDARGAEIRFSYSASGLRGEELTVAYSLLKVERDDTPGAVVFGKDRVLALTDIPKGCSWTSGEDLFVEIQPSRGTRYLVVLELYRGDLDDPSARDDVERLDLTQTAIFSG